MDFAGMEQQRKLGRKGESAEQAAIDAQLAMTRTQSEDQALQNMINLRKNLGSQLAVQAARGTSSSAGSAFALQQESIGTFGRDEAARKLNLLSNETLLKNAKYMSTFNRLSAESQAKQKFFKNTLSTAGSAAMMGGSGGGASSGAGASTSSASQASAFSQWRESQYNKKVG